MNQGMLLCFAINTMLESWIWKMHIMMDSVVEEAHEMVNNLHHHHVDVFKAVIDMQLQELNCRFNEAKTKLLLCITFLYPCSLSKLLIWIN
uniref:Uncharacterized protein n=1 Tax=Lactuca sativa TaxID=4236 RepID=A0A9R1VGK2_LACSA|nr:hypothetical protein LSAT_V11C500265010 [Lactuca sativa]